MSAFIVTDANHSRTSIITVLNEFFQYTPVINTISGCSMGLFRVYVSRVRVPRACYVPMLCLVRARMCVCAWLVGACSVVTHPPSG